MRLTDTTPQEVVRALASTGARDEDVLYAAKTEFSAPFRYQRISGVCLVVVGVLVSLTGLGAIIGIPTGAFGYWIWRKGERNLGVVNRAFTGYCLGTKHPERI